MVKIFPKPEKIQINEKIMSNFGDVSINASPLSNNAVGSFKKVIDDFKITGEAAFEIYFYSDKTLKSEAYRIIVSNRKINIHSFDESGAFYALQTLMQIIIQLDGKIPELEIIDSPEYKYRGFMLDVGRYFYTVEEIKTFLDRMALHKLNLFHFHLTEDQGWRVDIKKYPLLTQIGSRRACTNFNNKPHGGYYTQEDIKEIVDYAHSLCIKVMPELDIPGHTRAAIAAYSELSCFKRELPVATHWGVKHDVLCAGREETYRFVFDVIDELCELFPDGLMHIGGDEVFKHRWELCPDCKKRMKDEGLKSTNELQTYFMDRVGDYLNKKGFECYMWNWDDNAVAPKASIGYTACNDTDDTSRNIIDCNSKAYYIDLPYSYVSLKDTVSYAPNSNALGVEATLWTEYVPNMKKADIMTYPRLGALCETAWNKTAEGFENELNEYYRLLDYYKISYSLGKRINPRGLRKLIQTILFERRQLTWEGLHNIIDDKKVEKIAKK